MVCKTGLYLPLKNPLLSTTCGPVQTVWNIIEIMRSFEICAQYILHNHTCVCIYGVSTIFQLLLTENTDPMNRNTTLHNKALNFDKHSEYIRIDYIRIYFHTIIFFFFCIAKISLNYLLFNAIIISIAWTSWHSGDALALIRGVFGSNLGKNTAMVIESFSVIPQSLRQMSG
jgi:hypothetical protein